MAKNQTSNFVPIKSLFEKFEFTSSGGFISREFQDYGYRLAADLNDLKHKSLYIKLSKELPRVILEQARSFVMDAQTARSKPKLFMWKVQQLRQSKTANPANS